MKLLIESEQDHDDAIAWVGMLMDVTGDVPQHPLYKLTDLLAAAIEVVEARGKKTATEIHFEPSELNMPT